MNDFPDLVPPPERPLTPGQRERLRAALSTGERHERHRFVTPVVAAAAVLAVVGGGLVLSGSLNGHGDNADPVGPGPRTQALPFDNVGRGTGNLCLAAAPRTVILLDQVTPVRDVVISSVELLAAHGASIGGSWFTQAPDDAVPVAGAFSEHLPGASHTVRQQWNQRRPLVGETLHAGTTYTFFARVTLADGGRLEGLRFGYRDGGTPATSDYADEVVARAKC